jgi:hypothetical protein
MEKQNYHKNGGQAGDGVLESDDEWYAYGEWFIKLW